MNVFLKIGAVVLEKLGEIVSKLQPDLSLHENRCGKKTRVNPINT